MVTVMHQLPISMHKQLRRTDEEGGWGCRHGDFADSSLRKWRPLACRRHRPTTPHITIAFRKCPGATSGCSAVRSAQPLQNPASAAARRMLGDSVVLLGASNGPRSVSALERHRRRFLVIFYFIKHRNYGKARMQKWVTRWGRFAI